jgi:hypothetical protein
MTGVRQELAVKVVVIGVIGLIGSKGVAILRRGGPRRFAASPFGVNTIAADRLKEAVLGAHVVIDLSNSPSFQLKAMLKFLETSASRLDSVSPTWVMLQRFLRVSCGCGEVRKRGLLKISGEEDSRTGVSEITGLH